MQNVSILGLHVLVHLNQTWTFLVSEIAIKVPSCTKIWDKSVQFIQICDLFPLLYPPEASGGYFGLVVATPPPLRGKRFSALTPAFEIPSNLPV